MTSLFLRTFIRPFVYTIAISILCGSHQAHAAFSCPAEVSDAIAAAQAALKADDPEQDRRALECLTGAVAALSAEVKGMRDGSIPMSGFFRQWPETKSRQGAKP